MTRWLTRPAGQSFPPATRARNGSMSRNTARGRRAGRRAGRRVGHRIATFVTDTNHNVKAQFPHPGLLPGPRWFGCRPAWRPGYRRSRSRYGLGLIFPKSRLCVCPYTTLTTLFYPSPEEVRERFVRVAAVRQVPALPFLRAEFRFNLRREGHRVRGSKAVCVRQRGDGGRGEVPGRRRISGVCGGRVWVATLF